VQQPSETDGRGALLAVLAMLVVVTVATNTTASLAQPQIADTFGVGPADTGWVVFGYSATFAVATALYGGIAARFGITRSLVGGVLLLAAGSAAAIVAPNMELLVVSRMVQGAGSGAIPTLSTALISRRFQGRDRARALGVVVAGVGGGQAVGPLLGGILLEFLGWRAAVSIGLVAAPAALILARSQRGRMDRPDQAPSFDLIGAGLVASVALSASFLLNRLPLLGLVPITIVPLTVLAATALALGLRTWRVESSFLPRRVLASPAFRSVLVLGAIGMSAFLGTIVVVPIAASRAYGIDGIPLGLLLLPMALVAAFASTSTDRIQERIGRAATTRLALIALCIGPLLLALLAIPSGPFGMAAILTVLGLGFGLLGAPLTNELSHSFGDEDRPVALGIYYLGFFLGAGFGAAISSAIVQLEVTLPLLDGGPVPGFASAELLLALLPGLAAIAIGHRRLS
jgi:MFS transporter, DHA2 family, metal-tetracycline-proton antiporter